MRPITEGDLYRRWRKALVFAAIQTVLPGPRPGGLLT